MVVFRTGLAGWARFVVGVLVGVLIVALVTIASAGLRVFFNADGFAALPADQQMLYLAGFYDATTELSIDSSAQQDAKATSLCMAASGDQTGDLRAWAMRRLAVAGDVDLAANAVADVLMVFPTYPCTR